MKFLSSAGFFKQQRGGCRVFVRADLGQDLSNALYGMLNDRLRLVREGRERDVLELGERAVLAKTAVFRHRNSRIRATFGLKRHGAYDRGVMEIHNQLGLLNCPHVPQIVGYGYRRNWLGLVVSTTLATEFIDQSCNLLELIQAHPEQQNAVLLLAFNAIREHLSHSHLHLDLWAGNILVTPDLSRSWLVDVEYFKFAPNGSLEDKLGFCLGYLHNHTIHRFISLDDYVQLVRQWLKDSEQALCHESTLATCIQNANKPLSRKQRLMTF